MSQVGAGGRSGEKQRGGRHGARRPDGGARATKARETRRRMLSAAHDLFVEQGYGATSLQDVAVKAGVAVQTIYFTFGNKRKLLKEVLDVTIAGDDEPIATMDRPAFLHALAQETAAGMLQAFVHNTEGNLHRVAPMVEVVQAARTADPAIVSLWPTDYDPRYIVFSRAAKALMSKPDARAGVSAKHAADVLFGILSPELYLLFVRDRGWPRRRFEKWALTTLESQLVN